MYVHACTVRAKQLINLLCGTKQQCHITTGMLLGNGCSMLLCSIMPEFVALLFTTTNIVNTNIFSCMKTSTK